MKNDTFIDTELRTCATDSLAKEVEDELNKSDPSPQEARAALQKAIEDKDNDGQKGED